MNHAKDPLLGLSVLLAILGVLQASTNLLSALAAQYPVTFGLVMTGISALTAGLTVYRNARAAALTAEYEAARKAATIFYQAEAARLEGDGSSHE